ncbi:MAG: hypothetical protein UX61_C0011G0023 [Parcubacteria group bacterium GW2011_GWA2_46_7]|nr:MAG: hypothetical protein UX15_C0025G0009 [Parcubacteria group bacterium GW2011_GWA1_45_7]KKU11210.1 MAG: hypothetical protein UX14_C0001G0029 [Parcubacteria group bacterium GW2011_GWF1_45_5]KKU43796.1 MAG: hypothetical protein UX61_C0011G0023 [Parcubacteria group bacterium GW2011_GWA2_46_7]KKU47844.1 MAG: hypothetical protein UX66_C0004G0007 [Parcubacteria group bacterium GW2011_GWF2_46_8]OHD13899.1 MAG: hypothetical protein A2Z96_05475 [Spirochaetes bacterium GWB1_48_6]
MNFVVVSLCIFVFLGIGGLTGTFLWWIAACTLLIIEWVRRIPDFCGRRIGRIVVLFGMAAPFLFQDTVRLILGISLIVIWTGVRVRRSYWGITYQTIYQWCMLTLCGYGALFFFSLVMRGSVWVWVGWVEAILVCALLFPCYAELYGFRFSRFEYWAIIMYVSQVILMLYFLPLPWGTLVFLFLIFIVWMLRELKELHSKTWTWKAFCRHFAVVSAISFGLFFTIRF